MPGSRYNMPNPHSEDPAERDAYHELFLTPQQRVLFERNAEILGPQPEPFNAPAPKEIISSTVPTVAAMNEAAARGNAQQRIIETIKRKPMPAATK